MASPFKMYLDRTMNKLRRETIKIVKMDPAPATPPITIYSFNSNLPPVNQEIDLVSGSDIDIGGYTTAKFTPVPISSESSSSSSTLHGLPTPPPSPTSTGSSTPNSVLSHIAFHGTMSLKVPPQYADKVKAGYAGMRNRRRTTLFGEDTWDLGSYTHIKVVVAYRGWEGWRNRWYCNVQTDGPILTDLYQHRLDLAPSPSSSTSTAPLDPTSGPAPIFRTLHLPISSFVLTNSGQTSEHQIPMMSSKIRTVGFSLLGGSRNEDMVPTRSTLTPAKIQEMRRLASSGYAGKDRHGSDMRGLDPELEQMLREDGVDVSQLTDESNVAAASWKEPIKQTAYHRITPASESNKGEVSAEQKAASAVAITPWSEGYYELSIQSVEGVKMDDKLGAEDRDM